MSHIEFESEPQSVQVQLSNGSTLLLRMSLNHAPKLGGGNPPRPGPATMYLALMIEQGNVLNIEGWLTPPITAPAIGGGTGPN